MGRRQDADNKSLIGIVYLCKRVQSGRTLNFADCLTDVGSALESIRKVRDVGGDGWDAGIRTPIRSSRGCSLTVRRRPNKTQTLFYQTRPRESSTAA